MRLIMSLLIKCVILIMLAGLLSEDEYKALKAAEKWPDIIALCTKDLAEQQLSDKDRALIYNRLTSSNFYLGNYNEALSASASALDYATKSGDKNQEARAFYLISSVYRAKQDAQSSQSYINHALSIADDNSVSQNTKAKIYYNAGALQQDLMNNPQKASEYYDAASANFDKNSDDYIRAKIRRIRCDLDTGSAKMAKVKAQDLSAEAGTRTFVHLLQLKAQIGIALKEYAEAYKFASEALGVAKDKGMKKECERLESLIDEISKKAPDVVAFVLVPAKALIA